MHLIDTKFLFIFTVLEQAGPWWLTLEGLPWMIFVIIFVVIMCIYHVVWGFLMGHVFHWNLFPQYLCLFSLLVCNKNYKKCFYHSYITRGLGTIFIQGDHLNLLLKCHINYHKNNALLMIMHYFFLHYYWYCIIHYPFWRIMIMQYNYFYSVMH